jgi:hypothetical protein
MEGGCERGGGAGRAGVRGIYKCINNFTVVEGGRPPRKEIWGEIYRHS